MDNRAEIREFLATRRAKLTPEQVGLPAGGTVPPNSAGPANLARFNFLDPRARDFYPNWDDAADTSVALLRTEAGRDPHNRDLTTLIGELATLSDEFRTRWAAHDVRLHRCGTKTFHHPVVGRLELAFDVMDLPADPGLTLTAYSAEPGSPSEDGLRLLASWAATVAATAGVPAVENPDHTPTTKDQ